MENDIITIVDADSLLYYCACKEEFQEDWTGLKEHFHYRVGEILEATKTKNYILFLTGKRCFRYKTSKRRPYKGQRKKRAESFPLFFALKAYVATLEETILCESIEADDAVSLLKYNAPDKFIVASPDKDVLGQVAGTHFNYGKNEFIETSEADAKMFLALQCLMGDSGDNIPGIEGMGIKGAEAILGEIAQKGMLDALVGAYTKKYGIYKGLEYFEETFKLVYLLKEWRELEEIDLEFSENLQNLV